MEDATFVLETLLSLCLLLFAAKIGGEIAKRYNIAAIVGELMAGVLLAPTLFGGIFIGGVQLIVVNSSVQVFAELGAVFLLFLVGLETRFVDFRRSGLMATIVATGGVIVPFVLGYYLVIAWGHPYNEALMAGAALTATSTAVTVRVMQDIGKSRTREFHVLVGATVIDDVFGLIVLAIVLGLVSSGSVDVTSICLMTAKAVGIWVVITLFGVFIVSRAINWLCPRKCIVYREITSAGKPLKMHAGHCIVKCEGPQEAISIATCLAFSYVAGMAGLAPILGAFAAGMSIAETKILAAIHDVAEKLTFLITPLFFVVIGTYVNLSGLDLSMMAFTIAFIILAMIGKIVGCGLPVLLLYKDYKEAIIVGLGMMGRGEVGLIIAGIGITSGLFSNEVFSSIVVMVGVTTVVTPIVLSEAYRLLRFDSGARQGEAKGSAE